MSVREKLEDRIKKKEQEIRDYESKISEAKAYIQALQDTIRLLPKDEGSAISAESKLRTGSAVYKAMIFLKKVGKPMHINEILKGIGKTTSKNDRISLSSSISWYVRRKEVFSRPAPNTFGLISMEESSKEPPDDFGLNKEETTELESF